MTKKQKYDVDLLAKELENLKSWNAAPQGMDLEAYATIQPCLYHLGGGEKETPFDVYKRMSMESGSYLTKHPGIWKDFEIAFRNNWLGAATPCAANLGSPTKAFPISCFVTNVEDSVHGIFSGLHEAAMLTKVGGGVGIGLQNIREQASDITGGGRSNGAVPWARIYDTGSTVVSQAGVRRGAFTFYINIRSRDLFDLLLSKDHSKGDPKTHIHSNIGVIIDHDFMEDLINGDNDAIIRWDAVMKCRLKSGSPLIFFRGNANDALPWWMKRAGLSATGTNICTEIISCADFLKTMICCLVSSNLYKYDEWKDWRSPNYGLGVHQLAIYFLDGVMSSFIAQSADVPGLEKAREYAIKGRPLGYGVFGWHAFLQKNMIAFGSTQAEAYNHAIFSEMQSECHNASVRLAHVYGTCEWAADASRRHIQLTAIAPTVSNSAANMGVSPGIMPIPSNYYQADGAAGSWERLNPIFDAYLRSNFPFMYDEMLASVIEHGGSCQHLHQIPENVRKVFLNADELDQRLIIKEAADRQPYIEQTQSINTWFGPDDDAEYISDVHIMAWQAGLPTLYYLRGDSIGKMALRSDVKQQVIDDTPKDVTYVMVSKKNCDYCSKARDLICGELNGRIVEYEHDEPWYDAIGDHFMWDMSTDLEHMTSYPRIAAFYENEMRYQFIGGYLELQSMMYDVNTMNTKFEVCEACED